MSLVLDYLNHFQRQWPIPVQGQLINRFQLRFTFRHVHFRQLVPIGAVSQLWLTTVLFLSQHLGYINLPVPIGLPRETLL